MEHCTHEARGLDVLPLTIQKFRSNGDAASADLLQVRRRQAAVGIPGTSFTWSVPLAMCALMLD